MKIKLAVLLTALALLTAALFSCTAPRIEDDGRLDIVAVNFPAYDFARAVCGDRANIRMLLSPGAESHTYEPAAKDIIAIQSCDIFIYTGGESDEWIETILDGCDATVNALNMMEHVELRTEEIVEGMEAEEEEGEGDEYDEHVWTSPLNAIKLVDAVCQYACASDPENSGFYTASANEYTAAIEQLDREFRDFFAGCSEKTLIFGDRFPMLYFTKEYGLEYCAAFPGCSSESEPSAATVAYLTKRAKELGVKAVYYIELSNHVIADTIAESCSAETALLNTCHNLTREQFDNGETYLSLMRGNLETLKRTMN